MCPNTLPHFWAEDKSIHITRSGSSYWQLKKIGKESLWNLRSVVILVKITRSHYFIFCSGMSLRSLCHDCGHCFIPRNNDQCGHCDEYICSSCMRECTLCDSMCCDDDITTCSVCNEEICKSCFQDCSKCTHPHCVACQDICLTMDSTYWEHRHVPAKINMPPTPIQNIPNNLSNIVDRGILISQIE